MIVDFTSIKVRLHQAADIFLRAEVKKKTTLLSHIGKHFLHEGGKHSYENTDHKKKDLQFEKAEASFTVSREEMGTITHDQIFQKIAKTAEEMASTMERGLFVKLSKEMDEAGQTVDEKEKPFSHKTLFKGLEMIDIDFEDDDRAKPQLPTLYMHPDAAKKAMEQDAKLTAEERGKVEKIKNKILDKKYADFMDRESQRKIID